MIGHKLKSPVMDMNLNPARMRGEGQPDYQERRTRDKKRLKNYLQHGYLVYVSCELTFQGEGKDRKVTGKTKGVSLIGSVNRLKDVTKLIIQ